MPTVDGGVKLIAALALQRTSGPMLQSAVKPRLALKLGGWMKDMVGQTMALDSGAGSGAPGWAEPETAEARWQSIIDARAR